MGVEGALGSALTGCLEAAIAAPSIHNSQPWRFRVSADGAVDVSVDRIRRLSVIDPHGRGALISVGAALFNLRVAMLSRGRMPVFRLLPSGTDTDVVATIRPGPPCRTVETAELLAAAIPLRRTNRHPFQDIPVPDEVLTDLADAAGVEGGQLLIVDPLVRDGVLGLARTAEVRRQNEPRYWVELAEWTVQGHGGRNDGVPPAAYGPWSAMEAIPIRDFGLIHPTHRRWAEAFEADPTIAVLYSPGDSPEDWLRAGQALERTLLTATVRGLATTLMTQPLEYPELRELIADGTTGRQPQAIIRFGYAVDPSAPTSRRPLADVVDLPAAARRA